MGLGGGDVLTGSAVAVNRETHGGILSFWSRGARSSFSGREGALSLGGDVRTTMVGADYAKGATGGGQDAVFQRVIMGRGEGGPRIEAHGPAARKEAMACVSALPIDRRRPYRRRRPGARIQPG